MNLHPVGLDQAILSDFILEGHFALHIRRMRELYAARLAELQEAARKYLADLLDISSVRASLSTTGLLPIPKGMNSHQVEAAATARGIEVMALDRFSLTGKVASDLLLGFGPFDEREIRGAVSNLAVVLEEMQTCGNRVPHPATGKRA